MIIQSPRLRKKDETTNDTIPEALFKGQSPVPLLANNPWQDPYLVVEAKKVAAKKLAFCGTQPWEHKRGNIIFDTFMVPILRLKKGWSCVPLQTTWVTMMIAQSFGVARRHR